ncbi:MAG: hypothetical protein ABIK83_05820 [Candidatus Zixiibacteriota bacterium]
MWRNVTLAVLLVGLFLASSSASFAVKDPNDAKRIPQSQPDAPKASGELNSALPEMPPKFTKTATPDQQAVVSGTFSHAPTGCDTYSYWDGTPFWFWTIPDVYDDDFFNMRFTAPSGQIATLANVYLGFYDAASSVVSPDGVDIIVWHDDGFGFPGGELARINIPAPEMAWYPNTVAVDFTPFDLTFMDEDFHIGFTTVNQTDDVYALLSDEGTTGTGRSSEYYIGMWGTMLNDWGLDVNFVIEAELCFGDPGPCSWLKYGNYAAAYYWTIPDQYGDDFFNERFTNNMIWPRELRTAGISLYEEGSIDVTGEGIDLMIWWDDNGFPGELLQTVNVPWADISWYPDETQVDLTPYDIIIPPNTDFHIGYTTVNQAAGNVMAVLSDDGSGPAEYRSSEFWSGYWGLMIDDWGYDYDFLIEAYVCEEDIPPPECNYILEYNGDAFYYWVLPDEYGDAYYNMRFTMLWQDCCEIAEIGIAFYRGASIGNPGADFILFNTDGTYPTDTIAVYTVPVITNWFPNYETIDIYDDHIWIYDEFHLGFNPILNDPDDVLAVISDDGSTETGRGGLWDGNWYTMEYDWGLDVAFLMKARTCCAVGCAPIYPCADETEWPTLCHDYARTGNSNVEIGSLCGFQKIWEYWSPYDFCYFANPTIADGLVYASFGVHLECFTVEGDGSGGPVSVWSTLTADPLYSSIIGGAVRSSPTVQDGLIYFGGGTFESMVCADAFTGAVIWHRSPILGTGLEGTAGQMRFCPTVILGDFIYFGGDGGTIYKLDKFTGVTDVWRYTPHGNPIWNSPSSDGVDLFIGCAEGLYGGDAGPGATVGAVYKLRATDLELHPDWPEGGFSGLLGWNEGTTAGATYSESKNWLFTNLAMADHTSFDSYAMSIDAADGTPATDQYWLSGQPFYAPAAVFDAAELWYHGAVPSKDSRYAGIWCRSYWDNNATWWDVTRGQMTNVAALTCDPLVFWGTRVPPYGTFNCNNAITGAHIFTYELTGYGFGPAIAKYGDTPYIAQLQLWSDCGTGGGRLTMYSIGDDRPRLDIPGGVVLDPPLDFSDPAGTQRTVEEVFCNYGCAPLEYCLLLEAHADYPATAFVTTIDPQVKARADKSTDQMVQHTIDDFNAMQGWKEARMQNHSVLKSEYADRVMQVKQSDFSLSGPPSWVTLASSATGMLSATECYDAILEFDVPNMCRGSNLFYLIVATDDPDYNECPPSLPSCGVSKQTQGS